MAAFVVFFAAGFVAFLFVGDEGRIVVVIVVDGVVDLDIVFRFRCDGLDLAGVLLGIGLFQTLALIPGVSRSGATIVGALILGGDKRSAAEFSFFLAMPTMAGAFVYDLYKNIDSISADGAILIAIGFVAAFLSALIVVKVFLNFVGRSGFAPFAWYRIALGMAMLAAIGVGWL